MQAFRKRDFRADDVGRFLKRFGRMVVSMERMKLDQRFRPYDGRGSPTDVLKRLRVRWNLHLTPGEQSDRNLRDTSVSGSMMSKVGNAPGKQILKLERKLRMQLRLLLISENGPLSRGPFFHFRGLLFLHHPQKRERYGHAGGFRPHDAFSGADLDGAGIGRASEFRR